MENRETPATDRIQLHLVLPYKFQPAGDPRVRSYLDEGWTLEELQRVSDREALLTFSRPRSPTERN